MILSDHRAIASLGCDPEGNAPSPKPRYHGAMPAHPQNLADLVRFLRERTLRIMANCGQYLAQHRMRRLTPSWDEIGLHVGQTSAREDHRTRPRPHQRCRARPAPSRAASP